MFKIGELKNLENENVLIKSHKFNSYEYKTNKETYLYHTLSLLNQIIILLSKNIQD